ncbi:MAG: class I SAM-dependent methyltransferase [Bacteroidales bacterium]|nr:class I SAM-dependent methyltransferase [Bacteroidales bacterium]HNW72909.1 class I SAM-dependent methyltransferase [Bacteroidales bacterium]HPS50562.1 class I SAM-dependent methyltransferase [Bacteroidales bacterium]
MPNYYSEHLNANNLLRCYEVAPVRVKQFLEAEIGFVLSRTDAGSMVLDLGCGYGRVAVRLAEKARQVTGIDISSDNIKLAEKCFSLPNIRYHVMDAIALDFPDDTFDMTLCIQNGISAFRVNPEALIREALRVTRKGGLLLFSSYSDKFWNDRLHWFHIQSKEGLIGEIDDDLTKNGVIVCRDGFRAVTCSGSEFLELASKFNIEAKIHEVDASTVFCEMRK